MSLTHKKDVPKLVKKYREELPNIDRDLLRRLIRVENNITNPSELKKLDRCLKKTFQKDANSIAISKVKIDSKYEKHLETIRNENLANPIIAYFDLLLFIDTLPSHIKNKLGLDLQTATGLIMKANQWRPFEEQIQKQERLKTVISIVVLSFINTIPMLLHGDKEK